MSDAVGLPPADVRLKRFVHYGSEAAVCVPGDRFSQECFALEKLTAIEEMLAESRPDKPCDAVNHILKAFMDGYSGYPECLVFALAACACQKTSEQLRTQAYNAVKIVCKGPKDLFLFVFFVKKLAYPTKGQGTAWRKAISEWYFSKDPLDLAAAVSHFRGFHGFTHRDLLKLCHLKTSNKAKQAIFCYILKGLEATKMLPDAEDPAVEQVVSYLASVEDIKHQTNVETCALLIDAGNFPIDVAPPQLLKSADIWIVVVPTMPLGELLESLVRLSCSGLLKADQPLEAVIVDRLQDQSAIVESHLHPAEVFCAIKYYENHAKNTHEFMGKLIQQGKVERRLKPAPKPNVKILAALYKLLNSTFKMLVPTGMRYLLALDLSTNMKNWKCNGSRDVKPAQAATLLALCLLHAEREVTVVAFPTLPGPPPEEELIDPVNPHVQAVNRRGKVKKTGEGVVHPRKKELGPMVQLSLDKDLSVENNVEKLTQTLYGPVQACQPVVWAQECQKPVDVFILITDYVTLRKREYMEPSAALQTYRQQMNLPNSKFISCALASNTLDVAVPNDLGMLDILGFNGKVPRIIEAFSRGAF